MVEKEILDFYKSLDFMKIGQAIQRKNWQAAAMIERRMEKQIRDLKIKELDSNIVGLRQCINRKDVQGAKQVLSIIIAKRVKVLNSRTEG